MNQKTFSQVAGSIFLVIALLHLCRLVYAWPAMIGGWAMPTWVSVVALVLAGYLAYEGLKKR